MVFESRTWPKTNIEEVEKQVISDDYISTDCFIRYFYTVKKRRYSAYATWYIDITGFTCSDIGNLREKVHNKELFCYYDPLNPKRSLVNRKLNNSHMQVQAFMASFFACMGSVWLLYDSLLEKYIWICLTIFFVFNIQLKIYFKSSLFFGSFILPFSLYVLFIYLENRKDGNTNYGSINGDADDIF